jgi:hypothetical protein
VRERDSERTRKQRRRKVYSKQKRGMRWALGATAQRQEEEEA